MSAGDTDRPWPDSGGHFGPFGGRFVPETFMPALLQVEEAWRGLRDDTSFWDELMALLASHAMRPSPLYETRRIAGPGGARLFLKREDLVHTGSYKINNALGQALVARRMGRERVVADTASGQHGVATATVCARLGLGCEVYMGTEDMRRQGHNVLRMEALGARVVGVDVGSRRLRDAVTAAMRAWIATSGESYYLPGSVTGPHPYPAMVRDFQSIMGAEAREQVEQATGGLPAAVVASIGRGSGAMGLFYAFLPDEQVRLVGVHAGGVDSARGSHAATLVHGTPGVMHGAHSYVLQDDDGQVLATRSVATGLDYPAVGPEHAWLKSVERAEYVAVGDREAVETFGRLAREEGILASLEAAHAVAWALQLASSLSPDQAILVCLSGRGEKDLEQARAWSEPRADRTSTGEAPSPPEDVEASLVAKVASPL